MNLTWVDWAIVVTSIVALRFFSLSTRSHCKSVADFLSANRTAGRYLLTIANSMGSVGTVTFVAAFEIYFTAGFPPVWWAMMSIPITVIILLSGWVFWRFRETRALTMAQFLEMRYSRRFRVFAGIICFSCGILNFGIFPAVAARFFIHFCGLPGTFDIPGIPLHFSTFAVVMALDLALALTFVTMGGQVSVMVTECAQGIFSNIAFVIIIGYVLCLVSWPGVVGALNTAPADASMLHPYHTGQVEDFNIWYYLIMICTGFYSYMSWQGTQGFYSSARNPHEQQMGGIIGIWRNIPISLLSLVLPIAAFAILKRPEFAAQAAAVQEKLAHIPEQAIQSQMTVPITMGLCLPAGIKGLLATTMLFFSFTCHDTYMHSWGAIFVQDVILPFRRRPLTPAQHLRWLRWSIAGVALFGFCFSLLYPQTQKIVMFFAITGTIWLGGSGAVIVGGLYWKRGTTAAAYAAVILGALVGVAGLFADPIWMYLFKKEFPLHGQYQMFLGALASLLVYIVVSLMTGRGKPAADLEKLLHRGKYAVRDAGAAAAPPQPGISGRILGITARFTRRDKFLAGALIAWNLGWFVTFLAGTAIHFTVGTSVAWWAGFWHTYLILQFAVSIPTTLWLSIGGILDIKALFRTLERTVRDPRDDGRVNHQETKNSNSNPDESGNHQDTKNSNGNSN